VIYLHTNSPTNEELLSAAEAAAVFGFVVRCNRRWIIVRFMRFGYAATVSYCCQISTDTRPSSLSLAIQSVIGSEEGSTEIAA